MQNLKSFESLLEKIQSAKSDFGKRVFRSGLLYGRSGDIVVVEQNPYKKSIYALLSNSGATVLQVIDISKNQYIGVFINNTLLFYDLFLKQFLDITELMMWIVSKLPKTHVDELMHYKITIYKTEKILATMIENTNSSKQTFLVSDHALREYLGGRNHCLS